MMRTHEHTASASALSRWLGSGLIFLFLFLAASDPFRFLRYLAGQGGADPVTDGVKLALWAGLYGLFALWLLTRFGQVAWLWAHNRLWLALYGVLVLSPLWADQPIATLKACAAPLGTAMVTSLLALTFCPRTLTRWSALAISMVALASSLAVMVYPDYAIMSGRHDGFWRGITGQKNTLAQIMLAGLCLNILAAYWSRGRPRGGYLAGALLCLTVMVQAGSATAWVVLLLVALGVCIYVVLSRLGRSLSWVLTVPTLVLTLALVLLWLGPLVSEPLLHLLNRDAGLSDRIPIWHGVGQAIQDRLWLGYGYGQFWTPAQGIAISYIREFLLWDAPHAHNGLLELALNLGLLGVGVFALALVGMLVRLLQLWRLGERDLCLFAALVLALTTGLNASEVTLLTGANLLWVLFLYVPLRSAVQLWQLLTQAAVSATTLRAGAACAERVGVGRPTER